MPRLWSVSVNCVISMQPYDAANSDGAKSYHTLQDHVWRKEEWKDCEKLSVRWISQSPVWLMPLSFAGAKLVRMGSQISLDWLGPLSQVWPDLPFMRVSPQTLPIWTKPNCSNSYPIWSATLWTGIFHGSPHVSQGPLQLFSLAMWLFMTLSEWQNDSSNISKVMIHMRLVLVVKEARTSDSWLSVKDDHPDPIVTNTTAAMAIMP